MAKVRYGTATAFGMFDAIYQMVAGLVLILYCTKLGGIPYGAALVVSALITGTMVVFARRARWARVAVLMLGLAQLFLIFGIGFLVDQLDGIKYVASNGVFALRVMAFYTGATLTISGVMFCNLDDEENASKLSLFTALYKLGSVVGVFFSMFIPALLVWQKTGKKSFSEWLLGFGGENPDELLLLDEFDLFVANWGPVFAGIGALLIALVPTYLWLLDSRKMVVGKRSLLKTIILDCLALPFFAFAEWTLLSDFLKNGKIVSIIFMVLILLCYAGIWFVSYILPKLLGGANPLSYTEEVVYAPAEEPVSAVVE